MIQEVARREFVASGYHAVSVRNLARKAGLSLSVLYHYYSSKQELLYDLLIDVVDDFYCLLRCRPDEMGNDTGPVRQLMALVESTVEYRAYLPEESLLLIREMRNLESPYTEFLKERRREAVAIYATAIDRGVEAGVFTTPYPADARRAIFAMLDAIPNWYRRTGDVTVDMLIKRYQRLALAAVEHNGSFDNVEDL
ncbi:TetR/AcrR family transcriptional regulator [Mycolicibacter kumamotonensis]|uniref:TetR/AcrR family transcriptional regulator n=1 Tax=Mycolicibacter kumamotonensis TaxID=354243 RepID=A0A7K3LBI3_9MYCO|nr:TetR/AcrR family transcriptional regulator [Mycolicibacter kumamotonensis]